MFKWFHNLSTGEADYFNETFSSDSCVEGYDSHGNFHHITLCGNMGVDSFTGDTYYKMGNIIQKAGSTDSFYFPYSDDEDDNDPFDL